MPLTCSQIITLALQNSRKNTSFVTGGGFSTQAGQLLQMILDDLCYKYDLKVNIKPASVVLTGLPTPPQFIGSQPGIGPYVLPMDYLRMAQDEVIYNYQGAPQRMVNVELSEIDFLGILPLNSTYPTKFATSSDAGVSSVGLAIGTIGQVAPVGGASQSSLYVWPPPQAQINLDIRYFKLQAAIPAPETNMALPWFRDQFYLLARLTGELLKPGPAAKPFLEEAAVLLDQYLKMEDDSEGRAALVQLDRRQFGSGGRGYENLPRTKKLDF